MNQKAYIQNLNINVSMIHRFNFEFNTDTLGTVSWSYHIDDTGTVSKDIMFSSDGEILDTDQLKQEREEILAQHVTPFIESIVA